MLGRQVLISRSPKRKERTTWQFEGDHFDNSSNHKELRDANGVLESSYSLKLAQVRSGLGDLMKNILRLGFVLENLLHFPD